MLFIILFTLLASLISFSDGCGSRCTEQFLRNRYGSFLSGKKITIITGREIPPFFTQVGVGVPYGLNADIINYIGYIFRTDFEYMYTPPTQFLALVQNNTNYVSISALTDTPEREQMVDFVHYFQTPTGFIVRSTYNQTINGVSDLCGKKIVVRGASPQEADVRAQNTTCGTNPLELIIVSAVGDLLAMVMNGTADVGTINQALLEAGVRESNNELKLVGTPYNVEPFSIACNKKNKMLSCAFANAINYLIQKGIYQRLLARYSFSFQTYGICPSRVNMNGTTCSARCLPSSNLCGSS
jgi:polar amino acid transport system substrate-binding protein